MNRFVDRHLALDGIEKADEFLVPMALHAAPDDLALKDIEGGEQGGRAMALVIVGHRGTAPFFHRQTRLGAIEGLDLALFVYAEDQRPVGWIEVEPDHVLHLGREVLVTRDFERFDQMRLELAVRVAALVP